MHFLQSNFQGLTVLLVRTVRNSRSMEAQLWLLPYLRPCMAYQAANKLYQESSPRGAFRKYVVFDN